MSEVTIKQIILEINKKEMILTLDEARSLFETLKKIFPDNFNSTATFS